MTMFCVLSLDVETTAETWNMATPKTKFTSVGVPDVHPECPLKPARDQVLETCAAIHVEKIDIHPVPTTIGFGNG
jgi:hypothetical protein